MMMVRRLQASLILIILSIYAINLRAEMLCPPSAGKAILLLQAADNQQQSCDIHRLDSLPQITIETSLPTGLGIPGLNKWSGAALADIARGLGAKSDSKIELIALNDYSVTIPMSDVLTYNPVLASKLNGKSIPIRNKGPLILIYPFDQHDEINNAVYQDYTIWMVHEIRIK